MSAAKPFPVTVTTSDGEAPVPSGNVEPIFHEIRHALDRLVNTGEETTIDLRAMPLAPGEASRIEALLGKGEVEATLHALGTSQIRETAYPGVWWIAHYNADEVLVGTYVEVSPFPTLLKAQREDLRDGMARLDGLLADLLA